MMDECFVPVIGGGGKVFTKEAFQINGQSLVLPAGVTWGDIKYLVCIVAESFNLTIQSRFKEIGGERICYTNYHNKLVAYYTPLSTDTEVPLSINGSLSIRYALALV